MESTVAICKEVLKRLVALGYESESVVSSSPLIFPSKHGDKRISEQELRQLFIAVLNDNHKNLYYAIETPTVYSYSFTNDLKEIKIGDKENKGQSALIDLCLFKKEDEQSKYKRLLNIEFKYKNATETNFSKDILKLMHEAENGAFVLLLKNTDGGTLTNAGETGVIDKLVGSIKHHDKSKVWNGGDTKFFELVILSLEEKVNGKPFVMHRKISFSELGNLDGVLKKWVKEEWRVKDFKCIDK